MGSRLTPRHYLLALAVLIILVLPYFVDFREKPFIRGTLIFTFLYAYLAVSWNMLGGYAGQFSFAHAAFFGIGAYVTAILWNWLGITPWIGMFAGAAVAAFSSLAIGIPSLRLRGHYFILITIAFSEIMRIWFTNWEAIGAATGIWYKILLEDSFIDFQYHSIRVPYYYIIFVMLLVGVLFTYKLKTSKWGYYFIAIREDETVASVSGINVTKYKLLATGISAAFTAIGGAFYAQYVLYVAPDTVLTIPLMVRIILPAIIGGIGTVLGPVIGAFLLIPVGEYIRAFFGGVPGVHLIIYGAVLIVFSIGMPEGIMGVIPRLRFKKSGVKTGFSPESDG